MKRIVDKDTNEILHVLYTPLVSLLSNGHTVGLLSKPCILKSIRPIDTIPPVTWSDAIAIGRESFLVGRSPCKENSND